MDAAFEDEDEHEARHTPAGIDSGPHELSEDGGSFSLKDIATSHHLMFFCCRQFVSMLHDRYKAGLV